MRTRTTLVAVAISQILLAGWFAGSVQAQPDGDWPYSASASYQETIDGNPLSKGDEIFNFTFTKRYFERPLGLAGTISYAPLDRESDLWMVDAAVVWYANYDKQIEIYERGSCIKPELIVFGGPGWAWLDRGGRTDGSFTVNGGVGYNVYCFCGEERTTSHWFLRPELWARYFTDQGGELDWGWGIGIGYGFGKKQTMEALRLRVDRCAEGHEGYDKPLEEARKHAEYLKELEGQAKDCGAERCPGFLEKVSKCIADFNPILYRIEASEEGS